jgi:excisionase family DNA binding protein
VSRKNKGNNAMTAATQTEPTPVPTEQPNKRTGMSVVSSRVYFIPHRDDPFLSASEAGRLVGLSHMTILRRLEEGVIPAVKDQNGRKRVRRSDLIRFYGITALAQNSPYLWMQEAELPEGYEYKEHFPRIRQHDSLTYYPVPIEIVNELQNGQT